MAGCDAPAEASTLGGPRCGRAPLYRTPLGMRCEVCVETFRAACRNPHTLVNILAGRARTEDEIEHMVAPIA